MGDKCERCGCNFVKSDDVDVCGVCLHELDLDEQYKSYKMGCKSVRTRPLSYDDWIEIE